MSTMKELCLATIYVLCGLILIAGCGKKEETPPASTRTGQEEPAAPAQLARTTGTTGTATISGKVTFSGEAPKLRKILTDADPKCAELHAGSALTSEDIIVNENGTLKNVFVYIKDGLEKQVYEPPKTPVLLDQQGCHYVPHVFGIQIRQPLLIRNSDPTLHNIHAMPARNREFNLGQPNQGMEATKAFATPEVMVHFKCDVHPWMSAFADVVDHPFYSVTGDDGAFSLEKLPAGKYLIEAWHEKYGSQTQNVTLTNGATEQITFAFKAE
jgi:hypothetical protein